MYNTYDDLKKRILFGELKDDTAILVTREEEFKLANGSTLLVDGTQYLESQEDINTFDDEDDFAFVSRTLTRDFENEFKETNFTGVVKETVGDTKYTNTYKNGKLVTCNTNWQGTRTTHRYEYNKQGVLVKTTITIKEKDPKDNTTIIKEDRYNKNNELVGFTSTLLDKDLKEVSIEVMEKTRINGYRVETIHKIDGIERKVVNQLTAKDGSKLEIEVDNDSNGDQEKTTYTLIVNNNNDCCKTQYRFELLSLHDVIMNSLL